MKRLVGQREKVNPDLKVAIGLADMFLSPTGPRPTRLEFNQACAGCKKPVTIFLFEEIDTGKIYLEGPDICEACGNQLADETAEAPSLSQAQIAQYFGQY